MKKILKISVLVTLTLAVLAACVYDDAGIPVVQNPQAVILNEFLNHVVASDYASATAMLTPELQAAFVQTPLEVQMSGRRGAMQDFTVIESIELEGFYIAAILSNTAKGTLVANFTVDANGHIASMQTLDFAFEPMMPPAGATYTAEAIVIGAGGEWPLDGLLTIPHGASAQNPVPALILVHGSGANNMDSSLFENRPFFDIADDLSSNGIAVLRYNERAFAHGTRLSTTYGTRMTVWQEYIYDVMLAAELLQADERISHVFVLGHSLGGIVAPRIAEYAGLDGVVIMASSPRPMHQISFDQNVQFFNDMVAAGLITQADADASFAALEAYHEGIRAILAMPAYQIEDILLMGAIPALYEQSIVESDPLAFMKRNPHIPVLVLHADRDFQTTTENDFQIFIDATAGVEAMNHVMLIYYKGLNHLMMTAYRQYGPLVIDIMEYAIPGRVATQVTRDITDFIHYNSR